MLRYCATRFLLFVLLVTMMSGVCSAAARVGDYDTWIRRFIGGTERASPEMEYSTMGAPMALLSGADAEQACRCGC